MTRASRMNSYRPRVERLEDRTVPSFLPVGNEFQVNQTTAGDQVDPAIAAAPDGHFVVVYATPAFDFVSPDPLVARLFNADGTPASGEIAVNQTSLIGSGGMGSGNPPAYPPQVAMDAQGDFVITWVGGTQMNGGQVAVIARRFGPTGAPLGDQFRVSLDFPGLIEKPDVAMDSQGGFALGWEEEPFAGSGPAVFGRLYDATGTPLAAPFQIAQTTASQSAVAVAIDSAGDSLFAWTNPDVFAQRYNAAGVAQGSAFQVNQNATNVQDNPGVAIGMDSTGNSAIAWVGGAGSGTSHGTVRARRFDPGGQPTSNEFTVSSTSFSPYFVDPHIAMNAGGAFVITWANAADPASTPNPDHLDVFAKLYDAAGADHSGEFIVNLSVPASNPGVGIDTAGDFMFAWQSSGHDGDGAGVLARRYIANSTGFDAQDNFGGEPVLTITIPYSNNAFAFITPAPTEVNESGLGRMLFTLNGATQIYPSQGIVQAFVNASSNANMAVIDVSTPSALAAVSVGNHGAAILGGAYIQLTGFDTVYAYLNSRGFGILQGTPGVQNVFNGEAFFATMYSPLPGAYYQISGAATIYAYSPGGFDQANLYTGTGPATFTVSGIAFSSMAGTNNGAAFFDEAVGFASNNGYAQNNVADTAIYYDSPASDTFVATSSYSYMQSNAADGTLTELDSAQGFAQTYAYSFVNSSIADYAYNYDPQHNHTTGFIVLT